MFSYVSIPELNICLRKPTKVNLIDISKCKLKLVILFCLADALFTKYSIKYTLFDGLAYNTCGYFASCVVLCAKPSNKRFIIPLEKKLLFCNWLLYFW